MFWGQWILGLAVGITFFAIVFGNVTVALCGASDAVWLQYGQQLRARSMYVLDRTLRRGAFWMSGAVSLLFAWLLGMTAASYWPQFLLFINAQPVGKTEPIFSRDVGFYMFKLPVWELFSRW